MQYLNELLWLVMLLVNFSAILFAYRVWGRLGLYIFVPIASIIANIQVLKMVDLFGFQAATLGNIVYASSFLITDILSENYGKKEARKAVAIGFFSLIITMVLMTIALRFQPAESDWVQESMQTIFGYLPRIVIASLLAYLVAQLHDIWAYGFWHKITPATKFIFLRNNLSTMVSQFLDTAIFTFVAFTSCLGLWKQTEELPTDVILSIFISTYVIKWVVAALDTPFLYIAAFWKKNGSIPEQSL